MTCYTNFTKFCRAGAVLNILSTSPKTLHTVELVFFVECLRQSFLLSVGKKHSANKLFIEYRKKHSAKMRCQLFFFYTRQRAPLPSTQNHLSLDKESDFAIEFITLKFRCLTASNQLSLYFFFSRAMLNTH